MEKQWVEDVTKSPQYKYGLIHPYLERFEFEDEPNVEDSAFYSSDEEDTITNTQQTVMNFLNQVRESRGYDVDCMVPRRFGSPFRPLSLPVKNKRYYDYVMKGLNFAMENINGESEKVTGKTYEFVEFKKIVETSNFMFLFTFAARVHNADSNAADVKTLQAMVYVPLFDEPEFYEWRVRPVPDATKGA